jgi:hypothetical protein
VFVFSCMIFCRKLYIQSQSQHNLPYAVYYRRNRINNINNNNNNNNNGSNHNHHTSMNGSSTGGGSSLSSFSKDVNDIPLVVPSKRVVVIADDPNNKGKSGSSESSKKSLFSYSAGGNRGFAVPGSNVPVVATQKRDVYNTANSNRRYSRHPHMHHPTATPAGVVDGIMADIDIFLLKMRKEYIEQYSKQLPDFQEAAKPKRRSMMTTLASSVLHAKSLL